MKKTISLLSLLLALLMLAACGAGSTTEGYDVYDDYAEAGEPGFYNGMAQTAEAAADAYYDEPEMNYDVAPEEAPSPADGVTSGVSVDGMADKIIYTAYGEIETTEFDDAVEKVYDLMDQYGAFLESSSVTGVNLDETSGARNTQSRRSASFCLRVPKDRYSAMTAALDTLGNVTYFNSYAENITASYTDTQSRLSAYEVEEERLLELLGQAEDVEDMLYIESRLSDIRYEKEWLTAQLRNWDTQVAYSTVNLTLREVKILTPEPEPEPEGYWAQVGGGFVSTLKSMGAGFKTAFRLFVAALPVILLVCLVGAVALVIVLLATRKYRKGKQPTPPPEADL